MVELEDEEEEEVMNSAESVVCMRVDTTASASARGVNASSGYPCTHREESLAMLNKPKRGRLCACVFMCEGE